MTTIDALFDEVAWIPVVNDTQKAQAETMDVPYATHEGTITIGGLKIKVVQLSNGMRLVTKEGLQSFLEWLERGGLQ